MSVNSEPNIAALSASLCNRGVKTIEEIRRDNLVYLVRSHRTQAALSGVIDKSTAQISQWITMAPSYETGRPRTISSDVAREIEAATHKERGWMDHDHSAASDALPRDEAAMLEQWRGWSDTEKRMFQAVDAARREPGGKKKRA